MWPKLFIIGGKVKGKEDRIGLWVTGNHSQVPWKSAWSELIFVNIFAKCFTNSFVNFLWLFLCIFPISSAYFSSISDKLLRLWPNDNNFMNSLTTLF